MLGETEECLDIWAGEPEPPCSVDYAALYMSAIIQGQRCGVGVIRPEKIDSDVETRRYQQLTTIVPSAIQQFAGADLRDKLTSLEYEIAELRDQLIALQTAAEPETPLFVSYDPALQDQECTKIQYVKRRDALSTDYNPTYDAGNIIAIVDFFGNDMKYQTCDFKLALINDHIRGDMIPSLIEDFPHDLDDETNFEYAMELIK